MGRYFNTNSFTIIPKDVLAKTQMKQGISGCASLPAVNHQCDQVKTFVVMNLSSVGESFVTWRGIISMGKNFTMKIVKVMLGF